MKKPSKGKLKKKVWKVFSAYKRQVEADKNGFVRCCTCGVIKHWKEVDAGHYVSGRHNAVLFDEMLVHPQCKPCNRDHGNMPNYTKFMMKRYGLTHDELVKLYNKKKKELKIITYGELETLLEYYTERLKEIENLQWRLDDGH